MAVYAIKAPQLLQILLALGQCGVAIAVIVVVRQDLWFSVYNSLGYYLGDVCYLAKPNADINMCSYTYWVVGLSFFLSIAAMFAQCFIRQRRSYLLATLLLSLVGTIWWLGYAITATIYGRQANDANVPYESSRNTAWILGWVNFGLFASALVGGGLVWGDCMSLGPEPVPEVPYPPGPVSYQPGPYTATGYPQGAYQQPYGYAAPPPGGVPPPGYPPQGYPQPPAQQQFATNTV